MANSMTPDWDPLAQGASDDPKAAYDQMRERCPVAWSADRGWGVFRYEDIVAVSSDVETFSSTEAWAAAENDLVPLPLRVDPPEHTHFRRLLQSLFRPAAVNAFEDRVRGRCVELLAPLVAAGEAEMVANMTDPYPVKGICDFLGWPADDWREIKDRAKRLNKARELRDAEAHRSVNAEWRAYIRKYMAVSRTAPGDDASSLFVRYVDEGVLTEAEAIGMLRLLLQAGHGTTTASTGICTLYLAEHPEDQQRLRENPSMIPRAVEEILRVDNPLVAMPRRAMRDIELHGRKIAAGDEVQMFYIAANRDEAQFPNATTCDFDRGPTRHLIFGTGIHTCIGAPFARLELRIYVEELLARTRNFQLTPGHEPVRQLFPRNEPRSLHIAFDPV